MIKLFISSLLLTICPLQGAFVSPQKIRTLYNSLDARSIAQQLAFYELYPTSNEGQRALRQASCACATDMAG